MCLSFHLVHALHTLMFFSSLHADSEWRPFFHWIWLLSSEFVSLIKIHFNFMLAYLSCTVIFLYICPLGFKILRIVLHSFNSFSYSASPIFKKILLIYVQSNVKNIINSVYTIKTSTNNKWLLILNYCSRWWTVSICMALHSHVPSNHKLYLLCRISIRLKVK